jgi:hypothetical protein
VAAFEFERVLVPLEEEMLCSKVLLDLLLVVRLSGDIPLECPSGGKPLTADVGGEWRVRGFGVRVKKLFSTGISGGDGPLSSIFCALIALWSSNA